MKEKKLKIKISLLVISFFLALFILEIAARGFEKRYLIDTNVYLQQAKPRLHRVSQIPGLGYELIPQVKTEDGFFSINSQGIRDAEYALPKPADVYRIIILGDSVTFGTEYPVEYTYPKVLESILKENEIGGKNFEVLNAGVCGYNAFQKLVFLKSKLLKLEPDLVIYQFLNDDYYRSAVVMPDAQGVNNNHVYLSLGEYFSVNFPRIIPVPDRINSFLLKHCAGYRMVNKKLYDYLSLRSPEKYFPKAYQFAGYKELTDSVRANQAVFKDFAQLSKENGFELVILLFPRLANNDGMDSWIKDDCSKKYSFKCINLFELFKEKGVDLTTLRIIPEGDCHPNKSGHYLTARLIYDWLKFNIAAFNY
ncbi:MAG: hypothetical protein ABII88_01990 [Candidatus Omnitrophota bacterium]